MAGSISFNVLVAIVPLLLAVLGITGLILRGRYANPADTVIGYLLQAMPVAPDLALVDTIRRTLEEVLEQSGGLLGIGTLIFIWVATRLVGTLRTALREIFDIRQDRGIVAGKIFDIKMVIAAGTLLTINVAVTLLVELLARQGASAFGIDLDRFGFLNSLLGTAVAWFSIWFMFVLIYRYLPARRIHWRIALIAATFTGCLFELLKFGFSWYIQNANYTSAYGSIATLIVLYLWIYYGSIAFILGGEVAQVAALHRIRRRQKERLM
jgi:membrane protein